MYATYIYIYIKYIHTLSFRENIIEESGVLLYTFNFIKILARIPFNFVIQISRHLFQVSFNISNVTKYSLVIYRLKYSFMGHLVLNVE